LIHFFKRMPQFFGMPNYRKSILKSLKDLKVHSEEERLQNEDFDEEIDDEDNPIKLDVESRKLPAYEVIPNWLNNKLTNNTEEIEDDMKTVEDDGDETNTEPGVNDIDVDIEEMLAFAEKNLDIPIKCIFCETCEATPSLLEEHYQRQHSNIIESYQSSEDEECLGEIYSCSLVEWFNTRVDATVFGPIPVNVEGGSLVPPENNPPNQIELSGNETDDGDSDKDDALENFKESSMKITGKYLKRKHTNPETNMKGEVTENLENERIISGNENHEVIPCKTSKSKDYSEE